MNAACSVAPTQESFRPLQLLDHTVGSTNPSVASRAPSSTTTVSSFGPPNPTTHIIEIDDSPVPSFEAASPPPSNVTSPSLISGLSHPSLVHYQQSHIGSDMPSADAAGATGVTSSQSAPVDDFKTPNVYINGLPPNFPEEQLLAMTREFGDVVSVRTFTRHVSDRPS